jgi:hypothetical protein
VEEQMTKEEYEQVFQHINGLSQKHAMGKIDDKTMYVGLKKLLEELIAEVSGHSAKAAKRKALVSGFFIGVAFIVAFTYAGFKLWQIDAVREWVKGMGF